MKYVGGPRDGIEIEEGHENAEEIKVQISEFVGTKRVETSVHLYLRDAFGQMVYRGPEE